MHALSLYLATSVIGGYFDAEFMADTHALWRLKEEGRFAFVSSELVLDEVACAPGSRLQRCERLAWLPACAHRSTNLPHPWLRTRRRALTHWRSPAAGALKPHGGWRR